MAIELEIIEYGQLANNNKVPLGEVPILARQRITAAGLSAAFNSATRFVQLRNFGDAVHCRFNATGVTTNAGTGDGTSFKLAATKDELSFVLGEAVAAGDIAGTRTSEKLDVRAA